MTLRQMAVQINNQIGSQKYRLEVQEGSWQFGFRGYKVSDGLLPGQARAVREDYCKRSYYCYVGGEPQLQEHGATCDGLSMTEDKVRKLFEKSGASQFRIWKWETLHKLIAYVKRNEPGWMSMFVDSE